MDHMTLSQMCVCIPMANVKCMCLAILSRGSFPSLQIAPRDKVQIIYSNPPSFFHTPALDVSSVSSSLSIDAVQIVNQSVAIAVSFKV